MFRLYKITHNADGTEKASVDTYEDVSIAEGNFEFQKGLAMETKTFTFLMLLNGAGGIHSVVDGAITIDYIEKIGEGTIKPRLYEFKTTTEEIIKSYPHDDLNAALADCYKRLGGAKQNKDVKAEMLRLIDANGNSQKYTYWVRPIEPAQPQAEQGE